MTWEFKPRNFPRPKIWEFPWEIPQTLNMGISQEVTQNYDNFAGKITIFQKKRQKYIGNFSGKVINPRRTRQKYLKINLF